MNCIICNKVGELNIYSVCSDCYESGKLSKELRMEIISIEIKKILDESIAIKSTSDNTYDDSIDDSEVRIFRNIPDWTKKLYSSDD